MMEAKVKSLKLLLLTMTASLLLLGCGDSTPRTNHTVSGKIVCADIVQINEPGTAHVVNSIKQNMFYWEADDMCFAEVLTMAHSSYPVLSFTCIPCEKVRKLK
jgi:hypothetical protein